MNKFFIQVLCSNQASQTHFGSKWTLIFRINYDLFFIYLIFNKKFGYKCLISLVIFLLALIPHFIWLLDNEFITVTYALHRTGLENQNILNHLINPLVFLGKQIGILVPFFILLLLLISKIKTKTKFKDEKLIFLISINVIPIIFIFLTSLIMGVKIRTMWMTPFYLFFGVLIIYIFQSQINLKKLKNFILVFSILFVLSPATYLYISISQTDKRTDYPGKQIANQIQNKWDENNFTGNITAVFGDEWVAGNLSYHLDSRPKWYGTGSSSLEKLDTKKIGGLVAVGDRSKNCKNVSTNQIKKICLKIQSQYIELLGNLWKNL